MPGVRGGGGICSLVGSALGFFLNCNTNYFLHPLRFCISLPLKQTAGSHSRSGPQNGSPGVRGVGWGAQKASPPWHSPPTVPGVPTKGMEI